MKPYVVLLFCISLIAPLQAQEWTQTADWVELKEQDGYVLDLRYATDSNFVDHIIYDCGRCFLRADVAKQLDSARIAFAERGLKIKLFDCYRPLAVQWELWEEVPDARYVADPRKGSMHNRGMAVDLTLVDASTGEELDMGTGFDFFGSRAYHSTTPELSKTIQHNRNLLKATLEEWGFQPIRTEWWHYSYTGPQGVWPIHEEKWECIPE